MPDKVAAFVPPADLVIRIEVLPDTTRHIQLIAQTPIGIQLMEPVAK